MPTKTTRTQDIEMDVTIDKNCLGIHVDDVASVDRLGNRKMAALGFVDVTAAPFNADPTGQKDSTIQITDAVFYARHHKMVAFFPAGNYLVSDTIRCFGGWSDMRTATLKYLPYCQLWGCVLMGDQRPGKRATIILKENSSGFDDPENPKPVLDFISFAWWRNTPSAPLERQGPTGMNQTLQGFDIVLKPGNEGAAAVSFDTAEGSFIQDCKFDIGSAYTAILGGPGSGGTVYNISVKGGQIGAKLNSSRPASTLVGCNFEDQKITAIEYRQRGPVNIVGCSFKLPRGATVLNLRPRKPGNFMSSASVIDCMVDYPEGDAPATGFDAHGSIYLRNVWLRNVNTVCNSITYGELGKSDAGWIRVEEAAADHYYQDPIHAAIHIDGVKSSPFVKLSSGDAPPEDLLSRHIWKEAEFPTWNSPGAVNVKEKYGAEGNGEADDTASLQKAIDENEIVFLPKGAYCISRTLRLKATTKFLGIHPSYSMIVPVAASGGDFCSGKNPCPAIKTENAGNADTQLAWFSVFMPRELSFGAYMMEWTCGGDSRIRSVFPVTGYTENDIEPLSKGIYPWHNWSWENFDFPDALGRVVHHTRNVPDPKADENEKIPNYPLVVVKDNGGGGWYPFMALDGRRHGHGYRKILVENCSGPFSIYHSHFQYCHGKAEMEIANSRNIAVYGMKDESDTIVIWTHDSENITITGLGGIGRRFADCKFLVENCREIILANLISDAFMGVGGDQLQKGNHLPQIIEIRCDGTTIKTPEYDRITLYKTTSTGAK